MTTTQAQSARPAVTSLVERVFDHLVEGGCSDSTADLVLGALEGESALSAILAGGSSPERPEPATERTAPAGAFLTGLQVEGFRGIGALTQLHLTPGPGLTVISGRNGSGKSSLAEALECALTGTTARWERRVSNSDFRAAWRNLHQPDVCRIVVSLDQVERGAATITVSWPKGATESSAADFAYQVGSEKRQQTSDALGWQAALQTYRPLLSYDDLGQLLTARPSELHDSIARALALNDLYAAIALLKDKVAPLKRPAKEANEVRRALKSSLETADDDRAAAAAKLLSKTAPDLDALAALVGGDSGHDPRQEVQGQIRSVELPDTAAVLALADALDAKQQQIVALGDQQGHLDRQREQLLEMALRFSEASGDTECPVCQGGWLDGDWRRRTAEILAQTVRVRTDRRRAEDDYRDAEAAARRLLTPVPAVARQTLLDLPSQSAVVDRWSRWVTPDPTVALGDHLRHQLPPYAEAVRAWQVEAQTLADEVADRWRPLAVRIAGYVAQQTAALELQTQAEELDDAHQAACAAEKDLRLERLQPIVDRAKAIWAKLRHESNVELKDIALIGNANRRGVDIQAVVDDAGSSALSVMSQGELNSLALALFLPRAASEESPFRFLVLDDPVQAMDPNKVEGLAEVLDDLARTRQVIVFSHDDRLAQAARRLPHPPTILTVGRGSRSQVVVRSLSRPAQRCLEDAYALLKDTGVGDGIKRRVLPGVLRQAVETAAWERHSTDRLRAGDRLQAVEEDWEKADRTRLRIELAVGLPAQAWLARDPKRGRALRICNAGSHEGLTSNLEEAFHDVQSLVRAIEGRLA
ncbi:MAG TPA: AAA family ATPase [Propionibacteriaceae bacterium]